MGIVQDAYFGIVHLCSPSMTLRTDGAKVKETFESWNSILWDKIDTDSLVQQARDLQNQASSVPV